MKFSVFVLSFIIIFSTASLAIDVPVLQKYVNDYDNILTQSDISNLNQLAAAIEQNSTVEIAVLIVNTTYPSDMNTYSLTVFRSNGVGKKDKNNGLLITIAIDDREWRIEVGYGLEGLIPDAKAGEIGRTYLVPSLQKGNYYEGLYNTIDAIGRVVRGEPEVVSNQGNSDLIVPAVFLAIWAVLFGGGILASVVSRRQKCPKCGTKMIIKETKDNEIIYECPKCKTKKKVKKKRGAFIFVGGFGGGRGGFGGGGFGGGSGGGGGAGGHF